MNNVTINNEINLAYPDSFAQMSEEALTKYFSSPQNRWGVYDDSRHIILSVSWKKLGFFSAGSDAESQLIEIEARMCRNLLNYQRLSASKMKVASKKAYGIRFEYRVKDAALVQVADLIVFKHKKKLYAIHFITRKSNAAATRADLQEVLNSISLS